MIPNPIDCKQTYKYGTEEANCTRGDNAAIYDLIFVVFPMWPAMFASAVCFALIYRSVREQERRTNRFHFPNYMSSSARIVTSGSDHHKTKSTAVAIRALWLITSFLITYSLDLVRALMWYISGIQNEWLLLFDFIIYPMQGFFNFLAFARGRSHMKTPEGRFLRKLLFESCLCCCGGHLQGRLRPASSSSVDDDSEQSSSEGDISNCIEVSSTVEKGIDTMKESAFRNEADDN